MTNKERVAKRKGPLPRGRAVDLAVGKRQPAIDIDKQPLCEIKKVAASQDDKGKGKGNGS
jgi:hypothetical protein